MTFWKDLVWIHASSLFLPLVKLKLAMGQRLRRTFCLLGDVGAAFHPGRPWTVIVMIDPSTLPWRLLSSNNPVCAKDTFGVEEFLWARQRRPESCALRGPAFAHLLMRCRCVWGCSRSCVGRGAAGCSQRSRSSRETPRHAGCAWNKAVRVTFLKLECVQIKQAWNEMQL